ncbi:acid phosphatase type 7-like [Babylonia areolata]|uniref:acid phosphatase type 7-like n=1 Tax=Babylonia areolata TaxID=304850 RepID=UPI003FD59FA6
MQPWKTNYLLITVLLMLLIQVDHVACWDIQDSGYVYTADIREQEPPLAHHDGIKLKVTQQTVQGLHVALAGSQDLRVTWMTPVNWGIGHLSPMCLYGAKTITSQKARGRSYSYAAGNFSYTLNTAILDLSVIPCPPTSSSSAHCVKVISYQCGDHRYGFSDVYHVRIHPDTAVPLLPGPQFAVVGDMGVPHGLSTINSIAARMGSGKFNASKTDGVQMLLHVGDISYADYYDTKTLNNSWVWVDYMNSLQRVAARVPYMTAPGNHEVQFEFAAYLNWLPMPHSASSSSSPFWFSLDYLGVHLLFFSTEHDFSPNSTQHLWMQEDLKRANENRGQVPWVVVLGHRPLYCSSLVGYDRCHEEGALYRSYLEDLLYKAHVDVVISGHIHHYERSYPVYQGKATQKDFHNPQAPVYIVNGGAGNPEPNDPTFELSVDWRAWYNVTIKTGFLLMTPSRSQLKFDYVFSDSNQVIDSFTITKK